MWLGDDHTNHRLYIIVILVIHDSPMEGGRRGGAAVANVVNALALATAVVVFAAAVAIVVVVVVVVVVVAVVVYAQMSHCQSLPHQVLLYIQRFQRHT